MKVLLLTPAPAETHRGSAATVQRYRSGLQRRGHLCEVLGGAGEGQLKQSLEGTIGRFRPDIVHAHDACRTGIGLLGLRLPWVVSSSGEDFDESMRRRDVGGLVCEVFRRAHRLLVPSDYVAVALECAVPESVGKVAVVPRAGEELPTDGTDLRRSLGIPRGRFLVLLPGGIRPAKGQHTALTLPRRLRENGVDAEMIIVGPWQDEDYAREVVALAENEPAVRVLPALSSERMGAAYSDADVVLVTSSSVGSSSAIIEAGFMGRPVVARRTPGSEDLVRHRKTGLLYDGDAESMVKTVLALAKNRSAAGALGLRLREDFGRRFDPEQEIDLLLSAYAAT